MGYKFEEMIEAIMDADKWNALSAKGHAYAVACDWNHRAEQWEVVINA